MAKRQKESLSLYEMMHLCGGKEYTIALQSEIGHGPGI